MNKILISLGILASFATLVFAQGFGGGRVPEGQNVPGQVVPGQGSQRQGGGSASMAVNEKFLFVLRGDSIYQYSVDNMKLIGTTKLPTVERDRGPRTGGRDPIPPITLN